MNILLLKKFNNYFNRIVRKYSTLDDYRTNSSSCIDLSNINFNPSDGVGTVLVLGGPTQQENSLPFDWESVGTPDYLVCYENNNIVSRWFVMEADRTRNGQYQVTLRRDLLAEYYDEISFAPVFIEKGNPGISDSAIFNREPFTFNQIKKDELLLNFDKRAGKGKGWVVCYLAKDETPADISFTGQANVPSVVPTYDTLPQTLKNLIAHGSAWIGDPDKMTFSLMSSVFKAPPASQGYLTGDITDNIDESISITRNIGYSSMTSNDRQRGYCWFNSVGSSPSTWTEQTVLNYILEKYLVAKPTLALRTKLNTYIESLGDPYSVVNNYISQYNGLIYSRDGKYYKIQMNATRNDRVYRFTTAQIKSGTNVLCAAVKTFCDNYLINGTSVVSNTYSLDTYETVFFTKEGYDCVFSTPEVEFGKIKGTIKSTRNSNLDAPYDLVCIPRASLDIITNSQTYTSVDNIAEPAGRGIALKGSTVVTDVQILPYCPFDEIIDSNGNIDVRDFVENKDYDFITTDAEPGAIVGIMIYPKTCRGTFDLTIPSTSSIYADCQEETVSAVDKKVKSETKVCRFVSPNFASSFDINIQKNKGISELNIDYFYKPYTPYIHVAPYFKGMYGSDFNDPKGLICSGEFSIATASSRWEEYQVQNKNYELIFNRQIQNLDVNNSIAMEQQKITSTLGVATAGLTGLAGGAVAGSAAGPIGTAVGAVVGGIASAFTSGIGARKDTELLKKAQTEARGFAEDMYSYQLGNIQALPYSLTRVSSFTENNKIFPFIEIYDCTEEEREALENKIKYNGMTIMRIGRINDFVQEENKYVQGKLVRLDSIKEDSHVVAAIANEIKEGAYYYGSNSI